ncbi:MAG: energy-coupling factor transporter ATPase [Clostridia bacterium]|nr:energy-coupling factor transporter ATPase [Clostridia bacterium]
MRIVSENLTYVYNPKSPFAAKALDGVTLTVEEGEFFGVIGHTGSGKSTFIQHLNGLIPVYEGSLTVGETDMRFLSRREFRAAKKNPADCVASENGRKISYRRYKKRFREQMKKIRAAVGMVFQYPEYQLFGETVFDDVAFGVKNFFPDYSPEKLEEAVKDAVTAVGLNYDEIKYKSPFDLSGGQKRRVAIAGVIVTKPQILVLDEPVAGLDPQGKRELLSLLHSLHGSICKTIVIVSHDMDDVAENCTRVAVFSGGRAIKVAPPRELFKDGAALESVGLDLPLTAFLAAALEKEGIETDTDFTAKDFVAAVTEKYRNLKK